MPLVQHCRFRLVFTVAHSAPMNLQRYHKSYIVSRPYYPLVNKYLPAVPAHCARDLCGVGVPCCVDQRSDGKLSRVQVDLMSIPLYRNRLSYGSFMSMGFSGGRRLNLFGFPLLFFLSCPLSRLRGYCWILFPCCIYIRSATLPCGTPYTLHTYTTPKQVTN